MPTDRSTQADARPRLSVVIPAYNEEDGIAAVIERTLRARPEIVERAGLAGLDILVVDDGSTDRTGELARGFPEVEVLAHERNRGYGAAIKLGFSRADGDLLGFLDADGTCAPEFFAELCTRLESDGADIAVGARLGAGTAMPPIRRLGNRIFARVISLAGGPRITDSASGMRVVRRSALQRLYPLPDGLNFTPAMSSLAIFDSGLRIVEVPMPYAGRTGRSKLSVWRDGLRFLRTIVGVALTYRPLRFLGAAGVLSLLLALGYGVAPVGFYLREGRLEERMIYRLVAVAVGIATGVNLVAAGLLGQQTVALTREKFERPRGWRRVLNRVLLDFLIPWGVLAVAAGVILNWPSLVEYIQKGEISAHWIYVLTGGLLVMVGVELITFGILARVVSMLASRRVYAGK